MQLTDLNAPGGIGANCLLLQVANQQTTWMRVAQITDAAGVPIRDLTWQIERPAGE